MRWLFKTEPSVYSFHDLLREERARWDGVANAVAQRNLRSASPSDEVFIYHTGDERQIVGIARIVSEPYRDPEQDDERLVVVDLAPSRLLPRPVTLAEMRADRRLEGFELLRIGRLSVVPVSESHWKAILEMTSAPAPAAAKGSDRKRSSPRAAPAGRPSIPRATPGTRGKRPANTGRKRSGR